jgi:hypothetical protein
LGFKGGMSPPLKFHNGILRRLRRNISPPDLWVGGLIT